MHARTEHLRNVITTSDTTDLTERGGWYNNHNGDAFEIGETGVQH